MSRSLTSGGRAVSPYCLSCEADFANQGAYHLADEHNPDGQPAIGVLTKPDRIPVGEEEWLEFIRNDEEPLEHWWFTVKQPGYQALQRGISWSEACREGGWISSTAPWAGVEFSLQRHLGTSNLIDRCSDVLSTLIGKRAAARQLPGYMPFVVTEQYIRDIVGRQHAPAFQLCGIFCHVLLQKVKAFASGSIRSSSRASPLSSAGRITRCADGTKAHVEGPLELEE